MRRELQNTLSRGNQRGPWPRVSFPATFALSLGTDSNGNWDRVYHRKKEETGRSTLLRLWLANR